MHLVPHKIWAQELELLQRSPKEAKRCGEVARDKDRYAFLVELACTAEGALYVDYREWRKGGAIGRPVGSCLLEPRRRLAVKVHCSDATPSKYLVAKVANAVSAH